MSKSAASALSLQIRPRELVILAVWALSQVRGGKQLQHVLAKHAPDVEVSGRLDFDDIAALEPLQLVKLATEALLALDLENVQWHGKAEYASWYAGPAPSPKGKRSTRRAAAAETPPEASSVDALERVAGQQHDDSRSSRSPES